ncbi:hypothetical protein TWF718_007243 [Orbilia javanica]|uniref:Carbohydrate kinase PfkB domain-containing protein n=1 Tax=Orbilia javanica TaxID=47235 RepID=A0AAN8RIM2_9PEZI
MSLLRASSLRGHIRPLQISQLAKRGILASQARYYSDDAGSQTWDPKETVCSPVKWSPLIGSRYSFAAQRPGLFTISQDVQKAMKARGPILALETAIYTHGFPKPDNYNLALEMEAAVRDLGVTPATIGILNGKIMIGMTSEQLKELTESAGSEKTHKISRRDLAYHIAASGQPLNGGTTIAGTILISHIAGIQIIATGGLGGVHKGGENSMDISADLTELAKSPVAVVTSGMKSFLDIPRTMEYLETQGVFVSTFGNKSEKVDIPGFFSRESGYPSPYIVESPEEAARILYANYRLGMRSANLYFNPIPEEYEIPKSEMDPIIAAAVENSSSATGKDNTPAVLAEIVKQTEGRSMEANRQLVLNNAKVGARMALELVELSKQYANEKAKYSSENHPQRKDNEKPKAREPRGKWKNSTKKETQPTTDSNPKGTNGILRTSTSTPRAPSSPPKPPSDQRSISTLNKPEPDVKSPNEATTNTGGILIIGGVGVDVVAKGGASVVKLRTSNPGVITTSVGGVAKNIAATLQQLDPPVPVRFLSSVGRDMNGLLVLQELKRLGLSTKDIIVKDGARTACYAAINSAHVEGGLHMAIADMQVISNIPPGDVGKAIEKIKPSMVCFDGNLDPEVMKQLCIAAKAQGALVVCEPTSEPKSRYIANMCANLGVELEHPISIISPNFDELEGIVETITPHAPRTEFKTNEVNHQVLANFDKHRGVIKSLKETMTRITALMKSSTSSSTSTYPDDLKLETCITKSIELLHLIPTIITKLGKEGVMIVRLLKNPPPPTNTPQYKPHQTIRNESDNKYNGPNPNDDVKFGLDVFIPMEPYDPNDQTIGIHIFWAPPVKLLEGNDVVSSNGAGDTFLGAFLHGLMNKGEDTPAPENIVETPWSYFEGQKLDVLVRNAQLAAVQTLQSHESHPVRQSAKSESLKKSDVDRLWALSAEDS